MSRPVGVILFFFLCLFGYTKLFGPIPFSVNSVQTTKSNLFSVSGTGEATAIPNTARLSIGITKSALTVLDAQREANSILNKITDQLKNSGIPEKNIKTSDYSISPDYDYINGKQSIKGYVVNQNLELKITPVEKVNSAIDIATQNGANLVGGVTFILDDSSQTKLEDQARKEAVENAKKKAQNLANASGIRLRRIVDVQEGFSGRPIPVRPMLTTEKQVSDTSLEPGENKISITVTLSYETL